MKKCPLPFLLMIKSKYLAFFIPFLSTAFLLWSSFWGSQNSVLSGSFFKARGSLGWLPLDRPHWCLSFLLFVSPWASWGTHLTCILPAEKVAGVAAEKSFYPFWLHSEKENKQPKIPLQPSRLEKTVLLLLVPEFKVHLTFYRGDPPSQGAGWSGPGFSLVDN